MASDEGHIHWLGAADETVNFLGQELQLTSEVSNMVTVKQDLIGTVRIRLDGSVVTGLAIPTDGWQAIPGTAPVIEARADGHYPVGFVRLRLA